jgi:hypothetical protein
VCKTESVRYSNILKTYLITSLNSGILEVIDEWNDIPPQASE